MDINAVDEQQQVDYSSIMSKSTSNAVHEVEKEITIQRQEKTHEEKEAINSAIDSGNRNNILEAENEKAIKDKRYYFFIIIGICGALEWLFCNGDNGKWGGQIFYTCMLLYIINYTSMMNVLHVPFTTILKKVFSPTFGVVYISFFLLSNSVSFYKEVRGLGDSSEYDSDGYIYATQHLKSPSSAILLSYVTKKEMREKLRTIKLPKNLEVETYLIESQNSFGGMLQKDFVVFFWKGEPIHIKEDGLECFNSWQNWNSTKLVIKFNTGIDVDE